MKTYNSLFLNKRLYIRAKCVVILVGENEIKLSDSIRHIKSISLPKEVIKYSKFNSVDEFIEDLSLKATHNKQVIYVIPRSIEPMARKEKEDNKRNNHKILIMDVNKPIVDRLEFIKKRLPATKFTEESDKLLATYDDDICIRAVRLISSFNLKSVSKRQMENLVVNSFSKEEFLTKKLLKRGKLKIIDDLKIGIDVKKFLNVLFEDLCLLIRIKLTESLLTYSNLKKSLRVETTLDDFLVYKNVVAKYDIGFLLQKINMCLQLIMEIDSLGGELALSNLIVRW